MNISVTWGSAVGFSSLITLFFTLIFTGRLVPKSVLDRITGVYEKRLTDKDAEIQLWKTAYDSVKTANDALITQLYQSLDIGRAASGVLGAVPGATTPPPPSPLTSPPGGAGHGASVG